MTAPRSGRAIFAALCICIFASAAIAQVLGMFDPFAQDLTRTALAPSFAAPFGTDHLGRYLFSRVAAATVPTLGLAVAVSLLACAIGAVLGVASSIAPTALDSILSRVADAQMALPTLLLAMLVAALLGLGLTSVAIALIAGFWPEAFRIARAVGQKEWHKTYVEAARLSGFGRIFIVRRYVAREIAPVILSLAPLIAARAVMAVSALGFIGLSSTSPSLDWGSMVADGLPYLHEAPHIVVAPTLAIVFATLSLSLLSETSPEDA